MWTQWLPQQVAIAKYVYEPFGRVIVGGGPLASANVYRFSSMEQHNNSGILLYNRRSYTPDLHRWSNRDPLEEDGGINLYAYVLNSPVNYVDPDGEEAVAIGIGLGFGAGATGGTIGAVGTGGIALWGAGWSYVGYEIGDSTGFHDWLAEGIAGAYVFCTSSGERKIQGKHPNPWKGWQPDPNDPTKGRRRDPQTGKWKPAPRPPGPKPK